MICIPHSLAYKKRILCGKGSDKRALEHRLKLYAGMHDSIKYGKAYLIRCYVCTSTRTLSGSGKPFSPSFSNLTAKHLQGVTEAACGAN